MRIEHRYTKPRLPMPTDDDRITMLAEQIAVCRKELADLIASREVRVPQPHSRQLAAPTPNCPPSTPAVSWLLRPPTPLGSLPA
jgi:hypothetical protein